jgi:hypothetical protein
MGVCVSERFFRGDVRLYNIAVYFSNIFSVVLDTGLVKKAREKEREGKKIKHFFFFPSIFSPFFSFIKDFLVSPTQAGVEHSFYLKNTKKASPILLYIQYIPVCVCVSTHFLIKNILSFFGSRFVNSATQLFDIYFVTLSLVPTFSSLPINFLQIYK